MTINTVQLFINPRAGWFARRRTAALQRCFVASGVTIIEARGEVGSHEIDERADHICCAGGDGTLRHVLAALCRSGRNVSLSVYPNGTVNLIARESGYPRDPVAFVQRILDGRQRARHYIGFVGDVPMASCASVGPDSYAVEAVSPGLKRVIGRAAYIVAYCGLMLRWPRAEMMLSTAGRQIACEAVYVAKGHYFAGRWVLTPEASVRSPAFEVIALRRASRIEFLQLAWFLLMGWPARNLPSAEHFSCSELTIASEHRSSLQADGDIVALLPVGIALRQTAIEFA